MGLLLGYAALLEYSSLFGPPFLSQQMGLMMFLPRKGLPVQGRARRYCVGFARGGDGRLENPLDSSYQVFCIYMLPCIKASCLRYGDSGHGNEHSAAWVSTQELRQELLLGRGSSSVREPAHCGAAGEPERPGAEVRGEGHAVHPAGQVSRWVPGTPAPATMGPGLTWRSVKPWLTPLFSGPGWTLLRCVLGFPVFLPRPCSTAGLACPLLLGQGLNSASWALRAFVGLVSWQGVFLSYCFRHKLTTSVLAATTGSIVPRTWRLGVRNES